MEKEPNPKFQINDKVLVVFSGMIGTIQNWQSYYIDHKYHISYAVNLNTDDGLINFAEEDLELIVPEKSGTKFDNGKPQIDLIPYEAIEEIAKVLTFGCEKYGEANWANGIEMRRLLSAAYRHLGKFNAGEDIDDESQTIHLANAAANLCFAIWMYKNRPDLDNRWIKGVKK
jgi:hypothetical protein